MIPKKAGKLERPHLSRHGFARREAGKSKKPYLSGYV